MKKLVLVLTIGCLILGCKSTTQDKAYKTIYSLQSVTASAYDGYLDAVIAGKVSTNDLPRITKAFNTFQSSVLVSLDVVQFRTNAIASPSLAIESADLINLINNITKH